MPPLKISSQVDVVVDFTYLGSILSRNGSTTKELTYRIAKASGIVGRLSSIRQKPNVSRHTKMRIYNDSVRTALLYGAETRSAAKYILAPSMSHRQSIFEGPRDFTWITSLAARASCHALNNLPSRCSLPSVLFGSTVVFLVHELPKHGSHWTLTPPCTDGSDPKDSPPPPGGKTKPINSLPKHTPVEEAASLASDRLTWSHVVLSFSLPNPS